MCTNAKNTNEKADELNSAKENKSENKSPAIPKSIALTGGGTAGHVTPNLALIPKLQERGYEVHYFGTKDGIEEQLTKDIPGVKFHAVRSGKLRRYFSLKNFSDPFKVIAGYFDAKKALKKLKPAAIFSKGGFVTVPVVIAGKHSKVPVVLHESDYTPGLANRISMKYADKMLFTFEDSVKDSKKESVYTGTPIRAELFKGKREEGLKYLNFSGEKPVLLCMGGSQGALRVNLALREALETLTKDFDIAHLCGKGKTDDRFNGIEGYHQYEYIKDELPDVFAASSIAISRAGANSIFELLAIALPSLLIPLPLSASRGDQIQNADYFERKGYAMKLPEEEMSSEKLTEKISELYSKRESFIYAMRSDKNADGTESVLREIEYTAKK